MADIPGRSVCESTMVIPPFDAATMERRSMHDAGMPDFETSAYVSPGTGSDTQSVADGDWDSVGTWSHGVPTKDSNVLISHHVTLSSSGADVDSSPACLVCAVDEDGILEFSRASNTSLWVQTLYVLGELEIGTTQNPYLMSCDIVIRDIAIDHGSLGVVKNSGHDPAEYGNGILVPGGIVRVVGEAKTAWLETTAGPAAGATTVSLASTPTNWKTGDEIQFPATDTPPNIASTDGGIPSWKGEVRTLQADAVGPSISVAALTYDHLSNNYTNAQDPSLNTNCNPHALNLTRNIVIRSENISDTSGTRGHIMVTGNAHSEWRWVEVRNMGRTLNRWLDQTLLDSGNSYAPTYIGQNNIARYSHHHHHCWGRYAAPDGAYPNYYTDYPYATDCEGLVSRDDMPQTVLVGAVDGSQTTITVDDVTDWPTTYPFLIHVHPFERMSVTAVTPNGGNFDLTVVRDADTPEAYGTTTVNRTGTETHVDGATVAVYTRSKWSVITHDTHWSRVKDSISYWIAGAAFVSEQNETENVYQNNFASYIWSFNDKWRHTFEVSNDGEDRATGREATGHWHRTSHRKTVDNCISANVYSADSVEAAFCTMFMLEEAYKMADTNDFKNDTYIHIPSGRGKSSMAVDKEQIDVYRYGPYLCDSTGYASDNMYTHWHMGGLPSYGHNEPGDEYEIGPLFAWNIADKGVFHYPSWGCTYKDITMVGGVTKFFGGDYDWVNCHGTNWKLLNAGTYSTSFFVDNGQYWYNLLSPGKAAQWYDPSTTYITDAVVDPNTSRTYGILWDGMRKSGSQVNENTGPGKDFIFLRPKFFSNYNGTYSHFDFVKKASQWNFVTNVKGEIRDPEVDGTAYPGRVSKLWYTWQAENAMMPPNEIWSQDGSKWQKPVLGSPEVTMLRDAIDGSTTSVNVYKSGDAYNVLATGNNGNTTQFKTVAIPNNYCSIWFSTPSPLVWADGQVWQTRGTAGVDWQPFYVRIEDEIMRVDNVVDNTTHYTLTVLRGQRGTSAVAHGLINSDGSGNKNLVGTINLSMWNRYDAFVDPRGVGPDQNRPRDYPHYKLKTTWYSDIDNPDPTPGLCTNLNMYDEDTITIDPVLTSSGYGVIELVSP